MNTYDNGGRQLTAVQADIAKEIVLNGREPRDVLAEHGIGDEEFIEWITDGSFPDYTSFLASKTAHADEPFVWAKLFELIRDGNIQAIKLFFSLRDKKSSLESSAVPDRSISELRSDIFGEEDTDV